MNARAPIRVIGCGSCVGDDALAWEVVRQLKQVMPRCTDLEFHLADGGHPLLNILDGRGTLILIDAVAPAGTPGAISRFNWPNPKMTSLNTQSTHHLGAAEAMELAAALGLLPAHVVVFGLQAAELSPGADLSPPVAAAIPDLVRRIVQELVELQSSVPRHH